MKYIIYIFGIIATILILILALSKVDLVLQEGLNGKDILFFVGVIISISVLWYQIVKNIKKISKRPFESVNNSNSVR